MRIAIFAYSRQGCKTAKAVTNTFQNEEIRAFTMERFKQEGFEPIPSPTLQFYGSAFDWADVMVFVGSCGIAVREIAPHIQSKATDPAVIVIDELGRFAIPLLSGHIGGANALAAKLAHSLGAAAIITTATDINNKFSADAWAAQNRCVISDIRRIKTVSAMILEKDVPMCSEFPIVSSYPCGIIEGKTGDTGIYIGCKTEEPFAETLRLIPKILHIGIGCRKGTSAEKIRCAVERTLGQNHIDKRAVRCAASIDLKKEEKGLLQYCRQNGWPVYFYSAEDLRKVSGSFAHSDFVQSVTGIDNVCERSALYGADKLIIGKNVFDGVTVAVAAEKWEVRFE